jgi:hypothetical protein
MSNLWVRASVGQMVRLRRRLHPTGLRENGLTEGACWRPPRDSRNALPSPMVSPARAGWAPYWSMRERCRTRRGSRARRRSCCAWTDAAGLSCGRALRCTVQRRLLGPPRSPHRDALSIRWERPLHDPPCAWVLPHRPRCRRSDLLARAAGQVAHDTPRGLDYRRVVLRYWNPLAAALVEAVLWQTSRASSPKDPCCFWLTPRRSCSFPPLLCGHGGEGDHAHYGSLRAWPHVC